MVKQPDKDYWAFINCDDYEEFDEFVEFTKEYNKQLSGKIISVPENTQYVINNDPMHLVF